MPFHHNNSKFAFVLTATVSFLKRRMVWSLVMAHAMVMQGQGIDVNAEGIEAVGFLGLNALEANRVNDMASWFDETEQVTYLLVGCDNGTAFVRLLPGGEPLYMGKLPTASISSIWRDIKVLHDHAFVVSEADNHGMQVFDLEQLRDWSPLDGPVVWGSTGGVAAPGTAHNLAVNEDAGQVIQLGSPWMSGGAVIFSAANPTNPVLLGGASEWGSIHDAHAFRYEGPDQEHHGKDLLVTAGNDRMWILDVTDPSDVQLIGYAAYPDPAYAHQVWVSETHDHAFFGDELDELQQGLPTRTLVFDLTDLDAPTLADVHEASTASSDHNQYTHGEWLFQSNYTAGLRMLSDHWPSTPTLVERGFFDPYPETDATGFDGAWSHEILSEEGLIAMTSIEQGLWVLKPGFVKVQDVEVSPCQEGEVNEWSVDVTLEPGWDFPVVLSVENVQWPNFGGISWSFVGPGTYSIGFEAWGQEGIAPRLKVTSQQSTWPLNLLTPEADWEARYLDEDGDGYGNPSAPVWSCSDIAGTSEFPFDCQDWNANTYPNAPELCDGWDNDCNGMVDEGTTQLTWYLDADGDGHGDASMPVVLSCVPVVNHVLVPGDCNDARGDMHPGAPGTSAGVDNNCDGVIEGDEWAECLGDFDGDGYRNVSDMLNILSSFGCTNGCTASMNALDAVAIDDLLIYLSLFGLACE